MRVPSQRVSTKLRLNSVILSRQTSVWTVVCVCTVAEAVLLSLMFNDVWELDEVIKDVMQLNSGAAAEVWWNAGEDLPGPIRGCAVQTWHGTKQASEWPLCKETSGFSWRRKLQSRTRLATWWRPGRLKLPLQIRRVWECDCPPRCYK